MKATLIIGVVLILLGAAALFYQKFTYTSETDSFHVGPIHAEAQQQESLPIPPAIGWIVVAGGAVLVVLGVRRDAQI